MKSVSFVCGEFCYYTFSFGILLNNLSLNAKKKLPYLYSSDSASPVPWLVTTELCVIGILCVEDKSSTATYLKAEFSGRAYKPFTEKLSRAGTAFPSAHSSDVSAERARRPDRQELSSPSPDIRSTTIKHNTNHLPWPGLNSCAYKQLQIRPGRLGAQPADGPAPPAAAGPWFPAPRCTGTIVPRELHTRWSRRRPQDIPTRVASGGEDVAQRCRNPGQTLRQSPWLVCRFCGDLAPGCVSLGFPAVEGQLCPEGAQRSVGTPPLPPYQAFHLFCGSNKNNTSVTEKVKLNTMRHRSKFYDYRITFLRNVTNLPKT